MMWSFVRIVAVVSFMCVDLHDHPLMSHEDEKTLSSVLEWWVRRLMKNGTDFVISPVTVDCSQRHEKNLAAYAQLKDFILQKIRVEGLDLGPLAVQFVERNKKLVRIRLAPTLEGRFRIDTADAFPKYFQDNGGGWASWYKDNPKARGHCAVSIPVVDKNRKLIMVYVELRVHERVGRGTIFLFKQDGSEIRMLAATDVWVT